MSTQITVNDSRFFVEAVGFRGDEVARDRAIDALQTALYAHEGELTDDDLIRLGSDAAREATADWYCWTRRDVDGPALMVSRVEG